MKEAKTKDLRPELNRAIINYSQIHDRRFTQGDIEPTVTASHVNNVAAGKSVNKSLRNRIIKFINKYDG